MRYTLLNSPLGTLLLLRGEAGLTGLYFEDHRGAPKDSHGWRRDDAAFATEHNQLEEYFQRRRSTFELTLSPKGTPFQHAVWSRLRRIPFGATTSYGALAESLDRPNAARAVGMANAKNPISVIVPCHRVVGANGSLTGYAGGEARKRLHMELEREPPANSPSTTCYARSSHERSGTSGSPLPGSRGVLDERPR